MEQVIARHRSAVMVLAVAVPALACALLSLLREWVENTNAALGLVLLVVAAASTGLRSAGIVAALSGAVSFDYFLTAPYHRLTITNRDDIETTLLLLAVGLAVTELALWGRRQQHSASREQGYLSGMLDTSATVAAGTTPPKDVINHISAELVELLDLDRCRISTESDSSLPSLRPDGTLVGASGEIAVERDGLPTDTEIALPVRSGGVVVGSFLLTAASHVARPGQEQRRVAAALADLAGPSLETGSPSAAE
ncbi:K+-sensing histidine kinase KdpD [Microlunatus panaciterrae]|uniref:K+-sensing histidine kinase KdpD n=1 Tax=Microlunatus panaciterrae TaxID=400768 RepID=A0ABS2RKX3_9ACTN|nr:DUF4118 domain-containing protein [Microlunatus panaciterrae]MBM7798574.1 K+-sensing histidine kinase KdpD [Microlunatus panaciterrae]